jgi:hypothetical protein
LRGVIPRRASPPPGLGKPVTESSISRLPRVKMMALGWGKSQIGKSLSWPTL